MYDPLARISAIVHASIARDVVSATIVEVSAVAERIRLEHESENIAREDLEYCVVRQAELCGLPMVFGGILDELPASCDR